MTSISASFQDCKQDKYTTCRATVGHKPSFVLKAIRKESLYSLCNFLTYIRKFYENRKAEGDKEFWPLIIDLDTSIATGVIPNWMMLKFTKDQKQKKKSKKKDKLCSLKECISNGLKLLELEKAHYFQGKDMFEESENGKRIFPIKKRPFPFNILIRCEECDTIGNQGKYVHIRKHIDTLTVGGNEFDEIDKKLRKFDLKRETTLLRSYPKFTCNPLHYGCSIEKGMASTAGIRGPGNNMYNYNILDALKNGINFPSLNFQVFDEQMVIADVLFRDTPFLYKDSIKPEKKNIKVTIAGENYDNKKYKDKFNYIIRYYTLQNNNIIFKEANKTTDSYKIDDNIYPVLYFYSKKFHGALKLTNKLDYKVYLFDKKYETWGKLDTSLNAEDVVAGNYEQTLMKDEGTYKHKGQLKVKVEKGPKVSFV